MAEKRKLEFFVLRYVPDAVKGEFVNIGLVMFADSGNGAEVLDVRFTKDRSRMLCMDPGADLDVINALQKEIVEEIGLGKDRAVLMRRIEDSFSGAVQMSPTMAVLTEKSVVEEIEEVARIFLETAKVRRVREPAGRQRILKTMRNAFEDAGVLGLLLPVAAEPFTKPGDPFSFDYGYNTGSEIKLFHAVSMRASVDAAVLLAARYGKIEPEMVRMTQMAPTLTAVVEEELNRSRSEVAFALEMMEENNIRIARTTEMAGIAELARTELRA